MAGGARMQNLGFAKLQSRCEGRKRVYAGLRWILDH